MFRRLKYKVVLSTIGRRSSDLLITTSFHQQYNDVVLTSSLQRRFINNITTSLGRLLIDVVFTAFLQRHDIVERRRDMKTTVIQRRNDARHKALLKTDSVRA